MAVVRRIAPFAIYAVLFAGLVAQPGPARFAVVNLAVQLVVFGVGACLPAHRTGFMSYVDVAWPWGLVALGAQVLVFGDAGSPAIMATAVIYLLMGLRMGAWSLRFMVLARLPVELPRYRYQRRRWERDGFRGERLSLQVEILVQCGANATVLAIPALLAAERSGPFDALSVTAAALWALAWVAESAADRQKARFTRRSRREGVHRTCDAGMWRYSRHPNYFAQWMQWNCLILLSLPVLTARWGEEPLVPDLLTAFGLAWVSWTMYHTLVYYTGAVPAEHFSLRKRPDYDLYRRTTNRFFPGPRRPAPAAAGTPAALGPRRDGESLPDRR
ncbi:MULTISPECIES: DUF1295 domain-containing protein [unclassified Streptomyces]|uniref:DUF1295 domain-containing protein n=1 Tax=unclassified Streptomyces TaxID=2593676 RepID=UPI00036E39A8|nr:MULTISPECIES: DUF1295 domain-containing protein [unclassified Streptomyces]MYY04448.1 DUF1295 domain-containing protein [Streptomyces sp. SID4913]